MGVDLRQLPSFRELAKGPDLAGVTLSRQFQRQAFRFLLVVSDALMLGAAFRLAYWLRFDVGLTVSPDVDPSIQYYFQLVGVLLPIWLIVFGFFGLYDFQTLLAGTREYVKAFHACTTGIMFVVIVTFLEPTFVVSRIWLLGSWCSSVALVCTARFLLRRFACYLRRWGYFVSRAAVIGGNEEAVALIQQLKDWRTSGLQVLGYMDGRYRGDAAFQSGVSFLGEVTDIEHLVEAHELEELIVAVTALTRKELLELYQRLDGIDNLRIRLSSGLFELLTTGVQVKIVGFVPLMTLRKLRLDPMEASIKGLVEYSLAVIALIFLLPIFLLIAILIKLDSPGPVLHRRRVLGIGGREFDALKFRTMYVDGDDILAVHPQLARELSRNGKLKDDPRITRIGKLLRKYSLDELPQLFNVLKGQMGLVGPRMISPEEAREYGTNKLNLLTVKPGITGLWQVSGRSDLSYQDRVQLDMLYIRNYTIWRDLRILLLETIPAVIRAKGAY